nr:helix-turn-helix transcriptional regulator [Adlercreutzia muris]
MQWYAAAQADADLLPYVGFVAVVVLVAAYAFLLPERVLLLLSPRLLKLSHESLDDRCRDAAAAFGLTERETEIFMLLARGRDVGYIEKTLFISRNTVNTHRKNLYRKLGIHTQQELLSLIEDSLG